jgi:hypothetical protein
VKPSNFILANTTAGKPESGKDVIAALPIFNDGEKSLSSWRMTWRERISALVFGRAWVWVKAGKSMPPMSIDVCHNPALKESK